MRTPAKISAYKIIVFYVYSVLSAILLCIIYLIYLWPAHKPHYDLRHTGHCDFLEISPSTDQTKCHAIIVYGRLTSRRFSAWLGRRLALEKASNILLIREDKLQNFKGESAILEGRPIFIYLDVSKDIRDRIECERGLNRDKIVFVSNRGDIVPSSHSTRELIVRGGSVSELDPTNRISIVESIDKIIKALELIKTPPVIR